MVIGSASVSSATSLRLRRVEMGTVAPSGTAVEVTPEARLAVTSSLAWMMNCFES